MAKDPGFIFYPGDYLRDTQCLSEKSQVAYDRIMCEHMRNICIRQERLKFFTKRLSEEEIEELMSVLTKCEGENGGYQIEWVALSIEKRRAYSESRRKNRTKTYDKHMINICKHMENENEIENKDENKSSKKENSKKVEEIFEFFIQLQKRNKNVYKLTPDRRKMIQAALERHTEENVRLAMRNHSEDDFHRQNGCMDLSYAIKKTNAKGDKIDFWLDKNSVKKEFNKTTKHKVLPRIS